MAAKVYGYAETEATVEALYTYVVIDIILDDELERGYYQILRRFFGIGDMLIVMGATLSAEWDYSQAEHIRLRIWIGR